MFKNNIEIDKVLEQDIKLEKNLLGFNNSTNSHLFLLPLFELKQVNKFTKNYVMSYIGDKGRQMELSNCLLLLFKIDDFDSEEFDNLNKEMTNSLYFRFSYYVGKEKNENKNLVMFVYSATSDILEDYIKITNGFYSQLSNDYKTKLNNFCFNSSYKQNLLGIINKTGKVKDFISHKLGVKLNEDLEYWGIFDEKKEFFRAT